MIRPTVDSLVLKSFASRQAGAPPRCMSRMRAAPHASTVSPEGGMLVSLVITFENPCLGIFLAHMPGAAGVRENFGSAPETHTLFLSPQVSAMNLPPSGPSACNSGSAGSDSSPVLVTCHELNASTARVDEQMLRDVSLRRSFARWVFGWSLTRFRRYHAMWEVYEVRTGMLDLVKRGPTGLSRRQDLALAFSVFGGWRNWVRDQQLELSIATSQRVNTAHVVCESMRRAWRAIDAEASAGWRQRRADKASAERVRSVRHGAWHFWLYRAAAKQRTAALSAHGRRCHMVARRRRSWLHWWQHYKAVRVAARALQAGAASWRSRGLNRAWAALGAYKRLMDTREQGAATCAALLCRAAFLGLLRHAERCFWHDAARYSAISQWRAVRLAAAVTTLAQWGKRYRASHAGWRAVHLAAARRGRLVAVLVRWGVYSAIEAAARRRCALGAAHYRGCLLCRGLHAMAGFRSYSAVLDATLVGAVRIEPERRAQRAALLQWLRGAARRAAARALLARGTLSQRTLRIPPSFGRWSAATKSAASWRVPAHEEPRRCECCSRKRPLAASAREASGHMEHWALTRWRRWCSTCHVRVQFARGTTARACQLDWAWAMAAWQRGVTRRLAHGRARDVTTTQRWAWVALWHHRLRARLHGFRATVHLHSLQFAVAQWERHAAHSSDTERRERARRARSTRRVVACATRGAEMEIQVCEEVAREAASLVAREAARVAVREAEDVAAAARTTARAAAREAAGAAAAARSAVRWAECAVLEPGRRARAGRHQLPAAHAHRGARVSQPRGETQGRGQRRAPQLCCSTQRLLDEAPVAAD